LLEIKIFTFHFNLTFGSQDRPPKQIRQLLLLAAFQAFSTGSRTVELYVSFLQPNIQTENGMCIARNIGCTVTITDIDKKTKSIWSIFHFWMVIGKK
jgi:hypothetical protein